MLWHTQVLAVPSVGESFDKIRVSPEVTPGQASNHIFKRHGGIDCLGTGNQSKGCSSQNNITAGRGNQVEQMPGCKVGLLPRTPEGRDFPHHSRCELRSINPGLCCIGDTMSCEDFTLRLQQCCNV